MIRFIDLRGQAMVDNFSFYDTVIDKYIEIAGNVAWSTWKEFENDTVFEQELGEDIDVDRFKGLCPKWVFDNQEKYDGFNIYLSKKDFENFKRILNTI